jgi:AcrR family transcriptional regulator
MRCVARIDLSGHRLIDGLDRIWSAGCIGVSHISNTPQSVLERLQKPVRSNKNNRKAKIVSAFHDCILRKGYADTTITDVAGEAGLSLSHLLYYYTNKDEILIDLAIEHHRNVLDSIRFDAPATTEEKIEALVHNMFVVTSPDELKLLREFVGLSPHKPELRQIVQEYAAQTFAHLSDIFSRSPRQPGLSVSEAADLAGALWLGLMIQADSRAELDENETRKLFQKALMMIAKLE